MYPAEERFFHPAAHKKRMKPSAPSVPETAYLLFSREPPGEFERAAALSTFLRIPATCAPRRPPFPRDARRGRSPFAFLRIPATCAPRRFPLPGDARRGRSPFNFPSYPGDLRAPPSPFPGMREGAAAPSPFLPQAGACTPPRSDFLSVSAQKTDVAPCSIRSRNLCRRKIASASSKSVCGNAVRGF